MVVSHVLLSSSSSSSGPLCRPRLLLLSLCSFLRLYLTSDATLLLLLSFSSSVAAFPCHRLFLRSSCFSSLVSYIFCFPSVSSLICRLLLVPLSFLCPSLFCRGQSLSEGLNDGRLATSKSSFSRFVPVLADLVIRTVSNASLARRHLSVRIFCTLLFSMGPRGPRTENCAFTKAASVPAHRQSENAGPRLFGFVFRR